MDDEMLNMDVVTNEVPINRGPYVDAMTALIPDAIKQAPAHRLQSLDANLNVAHQFATWPSTGRQRLKGLVQTHWQLQGEVDTTLQQLEQNIEDFARPLLTEALKNQLNLIWTSTPRCSGFTSRTKSSSASTEAPRVRGMPHCWRRRCTISSRRRPRTATFVAAPVCTCRR